MIEISTKSFGTLKGFNPDVIGISIMINRFEIRRINGKKK